MTPPSHDGTPFHGYAERDGEEDQASASHRDW
jgi:hypothetical protein